MSLNETQARDVVDGCAEQRSTPKPEYTIQNAIEDALWLRGVPDGFATPDKMKLITETLFRAIEASPCFYKGLRLNIETFTLLAYDKAGWHALDGWIAEAADHGCREEKLIDARARLARFMQSQDARWPD